MFPNNLCFSITFFFVFLIFLCACCFASCSREYFLNGYKVTVRVSMFGTFACALMDGNVRHLLEGINSINQLIEAFNVIQERFPPELSYIYSTPVMSPIFSVFIRNPDDENNAD